MFWQDCRDGSIIPSNGSNRFYVEETANAFLARSKFIPEGIRSLSSVNCDQSPARQQESDLREKKFPVIQAMISDAFRSYQAGKFAETERICRQILAMDACHADSLNLLGMIEYLVGRQEAAEEMIRKAIAIDCKKASFHSNLGAILRVHGKLDDAKACFERALELNPNLAEAHLNLGGIFYAQGEFDEAAVRCKQALALNPNSAEAHSSLGAVFQAQGNLGEALRECRQAVALNPNLAEANHSLGRVFRALNCPEEALACYRRAVAIQPGYARAHFSESLVQLLQGDFLSGWRNYEWRWQSVDHNTPGRAYSQPLWKGDALASGRVLIWGEQGVGDEIMFAGLIPDVLRTGNRCVLDCDARLKPLFSRSFPEVEVVSGHVVDHPGELDIAAHLPSGSLPGLFRTTSSAFVSTASPYLIADTTARERFRTQYADGRRQVGLAWQTKSQQTGRIRSIDLSLLAPLFALSGIQWISLQYGRQDALQAQIAAAGAPVLLDSSVDQFSNVDRFAAQVAAMDMVITIDNSTAHLAAALGVPVWLLLPFAADWRWLQRREDSPWYPTMRLFRQPKPGDWESVVRRVHRGLSGDAL